MKLMRKSFGAASPGKAFAGLYGKISTFFTVWMLKPRTYDSAIFGVVCPASY